MKALAPNKNNIYIFAILAATLLLSFQNCSSSIFMIGTGQSVEAKTDFNAMIDESSNEVESTKKNMVHSNQLRDINSVEKNVSHARNDEPVEMLTGSDVKIKLILKNTKKSR